MASPNDHVCELNKTYEQSTHDKILRIYHECEGRIEKSVPRITVWHYEACRVMTNGDPEGRIFLSYPRTHDRFFFLAHHCFYLLILK